MAWGSASDGPLHSKIQETDSQLWLRLWLHGALQHDCGDYDELKRIQNRTYERRRPGEEGYDVAFECNSSAPQRTRASVRASMPSRKSLRIQRDPLAEMQRACRALEAQAKFALTLRVLRFGPLGSEELLGVARWIPPWRQAAKLLDEQEGEDEVQDEV